MPGKTRSSRRRRIFHINWSLASPAINGIVWRSDRNFRILGRRPISTTRVYMIMKDVLADPFGGEGMDMALPSILARRCFRSLSMHLPEESLTSQWTVFHDDDKTRCSVEVCLLSTGLIQLRVIEKLSASTFSAG